MLGAINLLLNFGQDEHCVLGFNDLFLSLLGHLHSLKLGFHLHLAEVVYAFNPRSLIYHRGIGWLFKCHYRRDNQLI